MSWPLFIYFSFYISDHCQVDRFPSSSVYNFVPITSDLLFTFPLTIYSYPHFILYWWLPSCSVWSHPNMLPILIIVYLNLYGILNQCLHLSFWFCYHQYLYQYVVHLFGHPLFLNVLASGSSQLFIIFDCYLPQLHTGTLTAIVMTSCLILEAYRFDCYWHICFLSLINESNIFLTVHSCLDQYSTAFQAVQSSWLLFG